MWHLESYDLNGLGVVQLFCDECHKQFGGKGGDNSKLAIHNFFASFKQKHLQTNIHLNAWCRQKGLRWKDHPQSLSTESKPVKMTFADHRRAVEEGFSIVESVNALAGAEDNTFVVLGDPTTLELKSFWYKVRCKLCGDLMQLCPPWKNLQANLEMHLNGFKDTKGVEDARANSNRAVTGPTSSDQRGRPPIATRVVT